VITGPHGFREFLFALDGVESVISGKYPQAPLLLPSDTAPCDVKCADIRSRLPADRKPPAVTLVHSFGCELRNIADSGDGDDDAFEVLNSPSRESIARMGAPLTILSPSNPPSAKTRAASERASSSSPHQC
jgi:hypothetical protein